VDWSKLAILVSWTKIPDSWLKCLERSAQKTPEVVWRPPTKAEERVTLFNILVGWSGDSFAVFWYTYGHRFRTLGRAEAEVAFTDYLARLNEARDRQERRKERMRQTLIFWTNFSRVFIKWALNIFYVFLAFGTLYLSYLAFWPVIGFFRCLWEGSIWLFTSGTLLRVFLIILAGVSFGALLAAMGLGFSWLAVKLRWGPRFLELLRQGLAFCSPPVFLVGVLFGWVGSSFKAVCEFVAMFYEENCPAINLVSPEEEAVEQVARGEVTK